jgi:hypothetical protein
MDHANWALTRDWTNWNDNSAEALSLMTSWLKAGEPFCHVRFGDGEFWSILGREGPNADGQEHLGATLGKELAATLFLIESMHTLKQNGHTLVGGYWDWPVKAKDWLVKTGLLDKLPWVPIQCFVCGVEDGGTLAFLEALRARPGKKYLVANGSVGKVAPALGAIHVPITLPRNKEREIRGEIGVVKQVPGAYGPGAYEDMPHVERFLRSQLKPGDAVIWCGGLGCKPTLYRLFVDCPGTTHIDMGCIFDLAVGLPSRTWMTEPPDARGKVYREKYIPWLLGKSK